MAEAPFLFFKELSASGHVVSATFFRSFNHYNQSFEEHLCSVSTDVISIYKVSSQPDEKLVLVLNERLFGIPRDIRVYSRNGEDNDILLLALDIGKLVTFEFIVEEARIALHTMCNIEENAIGFGSELKCFTNGKQTFLGRGESALIKVDQENQLVCMLAYGEFLFFCPLNSDYDMQEKELLPLSKRFLVHLQTQLLLLGPILDICFIAGYDHPVIAVLQQERFVPTGHLAKVSSTCAVSVLAVDVVNKKLTLLYKHSQLPHDCSSLLDLDSTAAHGMFMVVSNNALIAANGEHVMALPMNAFASISLNKDKIALLPHENLKIHRNLGDQCSSNGLELAGSHWVQKRRNNPATNITLFGMLASRDMVQIDIFWTSKDDFSSLYISGESLYANCEITSPCFAVSSSLSDALFVASRQGKAVLFRLASAVSDEFEFDDQAVFLDDGVAQEIVDGNYLFLSAPVSQQDDDPLALVEQNKQLEELILEDVQVYAEVRQCSRVRVAVQKFELKQVDCLTSIGSISQALFMKNDDLQLPLLHRITYHSHLLEDTQEGWVARDEDTRVTNEAPMISHASYIVEREAKDSLYVCHGKTFTRVYRGVPCLKVASRHFPGVVKCQTIAGLAAPYGLLFLAYESRSRVLYYINADEQGAQEMIIQESNPEHRVFITSSSTVFAGVLFKSSAQAEIVVQVTNLAVRVVKLQQAVSVKDCANLSALQHEALQDMLLAESVELGGLGGDIKENIIVADCVHGYVVVLTSYHNLHILQFNEEDEFLEVKYSIMYNADTRSNAHINLTDNPAALLELLTSRILYVSLFAAPLDVWATPTAPAAKPKLSRRQKEELELYGCLLGETDDADEMQMETSEEGGTSGNDNLGDSSIANVPYIVLTDREGYLSIVNLSTLEVVMRTKDFAGDKKTITITPAKEDFQDDNKPSESADHMIEAKLHCLHVDSEQMSYCLVILYHTGELRVFAACTLRNSVLCFQQKLSQLVHNHRAMHSKNVKAFHTQEAAESGSYLDSEDYANRIPTTMVYVPYVNPEILDAVFLSGSDPYILTLHRGMPVLHTVDMPETPYINYGHHQLLPIHCPCSLDRNNGTFSAEKVTYLSTLWFEYDDIELLKNPGLAKVKQARPSTLEIYRMIPDVTYDVSVANSQGLTLAYKHIESKDPIVKVLEFNRMLTDSKTEQALLNKKTYLMVSCPQKLQDIPTDLAADLGDDPEIVQLERYFPDVSSFSDAALKSSGLPLPPKISREYVLNLIQQGVVVDQHIFPSSDRLLDVIVFYAPIEHMGAVINPATRHSKQQTVLQVTSVEKRIMVLASTVERDPRGEDSQCFGKMLLFALDYALFDEDDAESADEKQEKGEGEGGVKIDVKLFSDGDEPAKEEKNSNDAVEKDEEGLNGATHASVDPAVEVDSKGDNGVGKENLSVNGDAMEVDPATSGETKPAAATQNGHGKAKPKVQAADFFENIQPKLRLVWTGPGPASVLAQMSFNTGVTNTANNNTIQAYISAFAPTNSPIVYGSYIVATVQSTVFIYKFKAETLEMEQVAFYFAQNYISSVRVFKNYILVTDVFHSVQMLFFREEDNSIHLVAKDFNKRVCNDVDLIIDQQKTAMVSTDDVGNLQIFLHQPKRWESLGGGRLICQSEFFMGAVGNVIATHDILYPELAKKKPTFMPGVPAPPPPPRTRKGSNFPLQTYGSRLNKINAPIQFYSTNKVQMTPGNQPSVDKRSCVLVGTARGTLGLLVPLDEKMYKRLALLQELMARTMVTVFALNPKDYRIAHRQFMQVQYPDVQTTTSLDQQTQHNMSASFAHNKQVVLDGVLLQRFVFLPHVLQEQLASVLGVTAYLIRENLHEIDYISRFF